LKVHALTFGSLEKHEYLETWLK